MLFWKQTFKDLLGRAWREPDEGGHWPRYARPRFPLLLGSRLQRLVLRINDTAHLLPTLDFSGAGSDGVPALYLPLVPNLKHLKISGDVDLDWNVRRKDVVYFPHLNQIKLITLIHARRRFDMIVSLKLLQREWLHPYAKITIRDVDLAREDFQLEVPEPFELSFEDVPLMKTQIIKQLCLDAGSDMASRQKLRDASPPLHPSWNFRFRRGWRKIGRAHV